MSTDKPITPETFNAYVKAYDEAVGEPTATQARVIDAYADLIASSLRSVLWIEALWEAVPGHKIDPAEHAEMTRLHKEAQADIAKLKAEVQARNLLIPVIRAVDEKVQALMAEDAEDNQT